MENSFRDTPMAAWAEKEVEAFFQTEKISLDGI
jgi:hypothetical protein